MINLDTVLDVTDVDLTAEVGSFKPIPDADYVVGLKEFKAWKTEQPKTITYKDFSTGSAVDMVAEDYTVHRAEVVFEVLTGEYKGRLIFGDVSTYPGVGIDRLKKFMKAFGLDGVPLSEFADYAGNAVNGKVWVKVEKGTAYTKKKKDPKTGRMITEEKEGKDRNVIGTYKEMEEADFEALANEAE